METLRIPYTDLLLSIYQYVFLSAYSNPNDFLFHL